MNLPNRVARLGIGSSRHRAGIQDHQVRLVVRRKPVVAARNQRALNGVRVGLGGPATKIVDGEARHICAVVRWGLQPEAGIIAAKRVFTTGGYTKRAWEQAAK